MQLPLYYITITIIRLKTCSKLIKLIIVNNELLFRNLFCSLRYPADQLDPFTQMSGQLTNNLLVRQKIDKITI